MKVPLTLQAQAEAELRRRQESRKSAVPTDIREYCRLVTPEWNWDWRHLVYIGQFLNKVTTGEIKRLIIQTGTRIGKTELVNVRYPSQRLELDPALPIMIMGYNETFAKRISRKAYKIVRNRIKMSNRTSAGDWETAAGGGVRAAGVGVGIAGLPAGLIMIDDPVKNAEDAYSEAHRDKVWDWYTEDVYPRLEPDGAIVITMARRHEDDLVGRVLAQDDGEEWVVVRLPVLAEENDPLGRAEGEAICPERFDEEAYAKMRKVMGEVAFSALQQQRPAPASGLVFNSDQVRYYTTPDHPIRNSDGTFVPTIPNRFDQILQSWDMTFKDKSTSDFVAGHIWARKQADAYFLDRINKRMGFVDTIKKVREFSLKWPKALLKLVEDKANGSAIIDSLRSELGGIVPVEPEGDKVSRAWSITPMFEGGNVWFPHPQIAPWVPAVLLQMTQFPFGANDDDVDSMVQALIKFRKQIEIEQRRRDFLKRRKGSTSLRLLA